MGITYGFYLRKDRAKDDGSCPIYLRITENRKSKFISTGVSIKPKHWNPKKKKIRKNHRNSKGLNHKLQLEKDKAQNIEQELSKFNKATAKAVRKRLKQQETGDFFDLADTYKKELKEHKRLSALKTLKVVINKLEDFENDRSLPLKHIDPNYLERFEGFLKREYGNRSTTINKNFEPIRAIIKKALKKHLITIDPFVNFEGAKRGKPKPKTKLSIEQIRAIEDLELEKNSNLWHTRNYFMFSFYSGGIRFGDLCCLKWEDIKGDRLSYQMNKNGKTFTIELNEYQHRVLEEYADNKKSENFIFPILNNHKDYSDPIFLRKRISSKNALINKWLDKISNKINAKIDEKNLSIPKVENVSFHVSRHSFAQHAVESGLSMYELMQALRHSKIETTQKYLKGLDEQLADKAMKKVF